VNRAAKIWRLSWRLAVCGLLLAWIFHSIFLEEGRAAAERDGVSWTDLSRAGQWQAAWTHGPPELWDNIRQVRPAALALSLVLVGMTIGFGVLRWQLALRAQGLALPLGRTTEISLVAHFFNSFLLGSTGGDLFKAYYAARETHHKKTEAVVTVFIDRLIGLATMLGFASLMMAPNLALLRDHERLGALAGVVLLMTLACVTGVTLAFWGRLSKVLPQARHWLRKLPKGEHLERSLDACRQFGRDRGFLARAFLLSMAINLVCVLQAMTLAWGLGLRIPPVALGVIVPMIICISALPITPSGLGVRENLYVLMLAVPLIDVPAKAALALSLLTFAGSLFWSLVGGVVYLTLRDRRHLAEVAEENGAPGST
jgi:uncharacterized protein (TIRG00374 family)